MSPETLLLVAMLRLTSLPWSPGDTMGTLTAMSVMTWRRLTAILSEGNQPLNCLSRGTVGI